MRTALATFVAVAWALWLGGLMALFIFVQKLFAVNRPVAVEAAPQMFLVFEKYQLFLAAAILLGTIGWRVSARSRAVVVMFCLFALAAAGAAGSALAITPKMESLRLAGEASSPEMHAQFMRLHGESMVVYLGETIALLIAGLALPHAMRGGAGEVTGTPPGQ